MSIGKIWPRTYELGQNFDNYKVDQKPTGNYFLSVLSTKIKLAIENEEVENFDVIGKIWLRAKSKAKFGLGHMNLGKISTTTKSAKSQLGIIF